MSHFNQRDSRYSDSTHSQGARQANGQVQVQSPAYAQQPPPNSLVTSHSANATPSPNRRTGHLSPLAQEGMGTVQKKSSGHTSTSLQGLTAKAAMGIPYADTSKGAKRQVIGRTGEDEMEDMTGDVDDPVAKFFHKKRDNRLPPLPDFKDPPPVMRTGFRPPDKLPILGQYEVHSYREYKKMMKDVAAMKLGGLGPNDSPEAEAARAKRRKIFQYGSSVSAVNFALMDTPEPAGLHGTTTPQCIPRKLTKEAEMAEIKRQRANQYGEKMSKFRVEKVKKKAQTPQPDEHLVAELKRLEDKHNEDLREIARIKAQLTIEDR